MSIRRSARCARWTCCSLLVTLLGCAAFAQVSLLDRSFNLGSGANAAVNAVVVQPDGRIVIGGAFTRLNDRAVPRLARLREEGTVDPSFAPGAGPDDEVTRVLRLADGRWLVAGLFTHFDGEPRPGLARLSADGRLDPAFVPPTGSGHDTNAVNGVFALAVDAQERIYVAGGDTRRWPTRFIERLLPGGGLDPDFAPVTAGWWWPVHALLPLGDGRVLAAGGAGIDGSGSGAMGGGWVVCRDDGSPDPSSVSAWRTDSVGYALHALPDQRVLVGGVFFGAGASRSTLFRLRPDLSPDPDFVAPAYDPHGAPDGQDNVTAVQLLPDGRLVTGGHFYEVDGHWRRHLVRTHVDGSVDVNFDTGFGFGGLEWQAVRSLAVDGEGRTLVAGEFDGFDGVRQRGLVRLLPRNDGGRSRLMIDGAPGAGLGVYGVAPAGQTNVLESSPNLVDWFPLSTNPPPLTVYPLPMGTAEIREFFRFRALP